MCYVLGGFGFGEPDKKKPNAAVELKNLGLAAVPQLIAHLDDARPTRCKGHWRSYWPEGHYLLRYGDCCQQIFESITGHSIYTRSSTTGYPIQDGKGKECKTNAARWWQDYQKKGEKQMLIEGTAAGDRDSPEQARRLAKKYPEETILPIVQGARLSKDAHVRASLIATASELKGTQVVAFLRGELEGSFLESRVKAARALALRGDPVGVKALVREWQKLRGTNADRWNHGWAIDELIGTLVCSGDPAGLHLLGGEMPHHPVGTRSAIIAQLARADKNLRDRPLTKEAVAAIEKVLVLALADLEEENSLSSRGDKTLRDPLLGDLAAEALAERWKQPKLFDITGPFQVRQRQRLEVKNVWLRKQGKDPVPVPPPRRVAPAPAATVLPLVRAVREAKTASERKMPLTTLENLGLPALPAVRKLLASLAADHPARREVQSLAARLALTVAEVCFADDSAPPDEALRRKLAARHGKPITEQALLALLRETAAALPVGARGVKLTLERIPDDRGVYLAVTLIADRPPRQGLTPQLNYGSRLWIGEKSLGGGSGTMAGIGRRVGLAAINWRDFAKNLRAALEAPPEEYLFVQAHCAEAR
jgi:hypothetical protein